MTADMLLVPFLPQKQPSSSQCDRPDLFSSDSPLKTEQSGLPQGHKHENFLTTLKKLLLDRNPSKGSRQAVPHAETPPAKTNQYPENDHVIDLASAGNDALLDIINLFVHDEVQINDDTNVAVGLKELAALLGEMGSNGSSAERMLLPGGELTAENLSRPVGLDQKRLTVLKQILAEIQTHDFKPGNDLSKGSQLRLLVANILAADTTGHSLGNSKDGLISEQTGGPVDLASWAKGISQGQENATTVKGDQPAKMDSTEKPAELFPSMTRPATGTENISNSKASGSLKGAESFSVPLLSESTEKTGTVKQDAHMRATVTIEPVRESSGSQKMSAQGPVNDSEIGMPVKADNYNRNTPHGQPLISPDGRSPSGGEQRQDTSLTNDYAPVSKLGNDTQVEKDNPLKIDIVPGNDTGSKVVKSEAGTNDGGQLGSQTQSSEKAHVTALSPKETEAGSREFRNQTMEQIVRRAVVQVRDGQHEARIDLKPDFMGHVRMQVITENQQVTVRILTEFGFVKDMIENNIQQLKADLQQQGLDVDKLDVSVSRDSNGNKHQQENAAHTRSFSRGDKSGDHENASEGHPEEKQRFMARSEGLPTVDYFA